MQMRQPVINRGSAEDMAIDMDAIRAQQRELNEVSDEIRAVKRKLMQYQESLDDGWKSVEIKGIDAVIADIIRRLSCLAGDLEDLGHDVAVTGEEIRAEEEARRRAEEEARRRAEEEARRRAEEEAQRRAEEEAQRRAAEEAQRSAAASRVKKKEGRLWLR